MSNKNQILDNFETKFSSYEEMRDFHAEMDKASEWRRAKVGQLIAFQIREDADGNITNQSCCETVSFDSVEDTAKNGTRLGLRVVLQPEYQGEGLFREETLEEETRYLPLRGAAQRSMLERAKISGFSLDKLDPLDLAFVLNKCFELYPANEAKILIRNDKITACHSNDYAVLPISELLETLYDGLENKFGNVKFVNGYTSHSFVTAKFELPSAQKALLKSYTDRLKKLGYNQMADNLVPAIHFSTSDTGTSCARCSACLTGNGNDISIGSTLEVEHKGKATVVHFGTKVDMLFSHWEKSLAKLEKLLNVQVSYPVSCMERVCKVLKLPKKASLEAVQQFEFANGSSPCTAHDIYIAMQEIPFLYRTGSEGKVSQKTLFDVEEHVARALVLEWNKYDIEKRVEW